MQELCSVLSLKRPYLQENKALQWNAVQAYCARRGFSLARPVIRVLRSGERYYLLTLSLISVSY